MQIKCLVVDDEPLARDGLARYVGDIEFLHLVDTVESSLEAHSLIDKHPIDLIFLDIQMPKLNGLDFIRTLRNPPMIVLTTAYPQYALEGFQLDVLDYLLKPITFDRFYQAANRAKEFFEMRMQATLAMGNGASIPVTEVERLAPDHFFVKVDSKYERINLSDILYVEGMQNYVMIHTAHKSYMTLITLRNVEDKLPEPYFMRIHKSYIVAKDRVTALEGNQLIIGNKKLTISRNYRDEVKARLLNENLLNNKKIR